MKSNRLFTKNIIANSSLVAAGASLSKILGFFREILIAAFFGASYLVDAYLVALVIPQMLFSIIGVALTTTLIPLITDYEENEGRKSAIRLLNSIFTYITLLSLIIIILGELFISNITHIVAPGFNQEVESLAIDLGRVMFPIILFYVLGSLTSGILQSQKRFFYPAFSVIPYNLVIIIMLLLFGRNLGIIGLAIGTILGVIAQWIFQVPDLRKSGFHMRLRFDHSHPGLKKMVKLIIPVIIGTGAAQINLLVDRMMASGLVEGSISALNYATKLNLLLFTVVAVAIASAVYPEFANAVVIKDCFRFKKLIVNSINSLALIILPVTVGMIILKEPFVRILFERGAFDAVATDLTVYALLFLSLGLPAMCLREIVLRAFYSMQDTLTPMVIGVCTVVLNIVLIFILVPYLAIGGLALASSISVTAGFLVMIWLLKRKLHHIGGRKLLLTGSKLIAATLIMGLVVAVSYKYMTGFLTPGKLNDLLIFGVNVLLGGIVYFIFVRLFKVEELDWVLNMIKVKIKRK